MLTSVSGLLLTGVELTLVLTPQEESEGRKSGKKQSQLPLVRNTGTPAQQAAGRREGEVDTALENKKVSMEDLPALPKWGFADRGDQGWISQHTHQHS